MLAEHRIDPARFHVLPFPVQYQALGGEAYKCENELAYHPVRTTPAAQDDPLAAVKAAYIATCREKAEDIATRKASQNAINGLAPVLPEFLGGSADLTGSNLTAAPSFKHVSGKEPGNYISYGVRE